MILHEIECIDESMKPDNPFLLHIIPLHSFPFDCSCPRRRRRRRHLHCLASYVAAVYSLNLSYVSTHFMVPRFWRRIFAICAKKMCTPSQ